MAISQTHYQLLKLLRERGELPQGGRILEIGKANWYGDMDPRGIDKEIDTLISDVACAKLMRTWLGEAIKNADCFGIVDVVYQVLFGT